MKVFRSVVVVLIVTLAFSGCTSMKPIGDVSDTGKVIEQIEPGQRVYISLKDGSKHEFVVKSVTQTEVIGTEQETVSLAEVEEVKVEEISTLKTTGAVVGGYILYAGIAALVALAALF